MAAEGEKNWEGKVSAKLTGCKADQLWPLLEDFFSIHKWISMLETSYGVEGTSGQLGCVRYCATKSIFKGGAKWALEKLVAIDPTERCLSYEFLENTFGYSYYWATMKVLPCESSEGEGCELVWSFVVNPLEMWKLEEFISFYDSTLQGVAERMREAVTGAAKQKN